MREPLFPSPSSFLWFCHPLERVCPLNTLQSNILQAQKLGKFNITIVFSGNSLSFGIFPLHNVRVQTIHPLPSSSPNKTCQPVANSTALSRS